MRYYHGSSFLTASGTVLQGRGHAYEEEWGGTDFYAVLEAYRPAACIPHKEAVFMCADEDIDSCGGSLDIICELEPLGNVTRHDMNWSSEISCLLGVELRHLILVLLPQRRLIGMGYRITTNRSGST